MTSAAILRARGLTPKKGFGQNFLGDARIARAIAEAATIPPGGAVVEIGAGLGALTEPLLERAARVVAIERDRDLVPILRETFAPAIDAGRLALLEADAVQVDWTAELAAGPPPRVVAGNLPYQITGRLLERATVHARGLDRAVFMVQAEVADRLAARPATAAYGALTVFVRAAFDVKRLMTVKAGAFHPRPAVDSAVVVLDRLAIPRAVETPAFRELVRAAFGTRRKTLRNAWRGALGWSKDELEERARAVGIDLDARGETLDVEQFATLAAH